jgi:DNA end-binding protein Ku
VTKEELENVALESTRTIEIDEFVDRTEIDPRYLIRPYYLCPDGKVGHDAFAVIRETIGEINKVAIGRVVLTNREHIIALEPLDKGLMGTLLRYPYEVRDPRNISTRFRTSKSPRTCSTSPGTSSIRSRGRLNRTSSRTSTKPRSSTSSTRKRAGKPITPKERPRGENVVDLMGALRRSVGVGPAAETKAPKKSGKKSRKAAAGQKEMLMPISGKKTSKEAAAKKPTAKAQRKSA